MKQQIRYALKKSLPVMAGYIFLGTAFGILVSEAGYGVLWAFLMSLLVYAGSMQFAMLPLMTAGVSPLTMAVTAFFVNSRHLFYGFSFIESFQKMRQKPYMIFSLTDETYSVLCGCKSEDPEEQMRDSWFWITLLDQCYWILGSIIGAILGKALPFDFSGIEFSMTALFVVILLEQILKNPKENGRTAAIGLVVTTVSLLLFGASKFLLPALVVSVLIVSVCGGMSKKETEGSADE